MMITALHFQSINKTSSDWVRSIQSRFLWSWGFGRDFEMFQRFIICICCPCNVHPTVCRGMKTENFLSETSHPFWTRYIKSTQHTKAKRCWCFNVCVIILFYLYHHHHRYQHPTYNTNEKGKIIVRVLCRSHWCLCTMGKTHYFFMVHRGSVVGNKRGCCWMGINW